MTNDEIRRMMEQVDERYIDELLQDAPRGSTALTPEEEPAEVVSGEGMEVKGTPWRFLAGMAAAVVLLVPLGWMGYQASRQFQPRESVEMAETIETQTETALQTITETALPEDNSLTLAEANALDQPWQGKVISLEQIGAMPLERVTLENRVYGYSNVLEEEFETMGHAPCLLIHYREPDIPGIHSLQLEYTTAGPELLSTAPGGVVVSGAELSPDLIGTSKVFHKSGDTSFLIDYGDYRVQVLGWGCEEEEIVTLIEALNRAAFPEESTDPAEEISGDEWQRITYADAWEALGDHYPGPELSFNIMHLDESSISRRECTDGTQYRMVYTSEDGERALELTFAPNRAAFEETDSPELDNWSMKQVTIEPWAQTIEDRLQAYDFWYDLGEWCVRISGTATIDEIDVFSQYYIVLLNPDIIHDNITPDEANAMDFPWKGCLVTLPEVAGIERSEIDVHRISVYPTDETVVKCPMVNIFYGWFSGTGFVLSYTTATAEELYLSDRVVTDETAAEEILSDERFLVNDAFQFVYDFGAYRLRVLMTKDCTAKELTALQNAVYGALH